MSKCYDGVPFSTTFNSKLSATMAVIIADFNNMDWLGDSTQLQMTKVGQEPQVLIQDLSMRSNYDCFSWIAINGFTKGRCERSHNLVYFKLTEDGDNQSLDVSRVLNLERVQEIGRSDYLEDVKMDYETLWSVSFALEASVTSTGETRRRRVL
jgi:hypothetical protein